MTAAEQGVGPVAAAPSRRLAYALVAVLALPVLVAMLALRDAHWHPVLDLAMTEARVRDVGGGHSPLIGLPGRIGSLGDQASHPGPVALYVLAPWYRIFGSSAWALQAATAVSALLAIATSVLIVRRRGGRALLLALGLVLAVLIGAYGVAVLTQPWLPYLPLMWWIVVLLAVWSVLCGDVVLLPVVVFAGSLCAQTHISYVGLAGGLGVVAAVGALVVAWRAPPGSRVRQVTLRWALIALGVGLVVWFPVVLDEIRHRPGNLTQLYRSFRSPSEPAVGLGTGVRLQLQHLDPRGFTHIGVGDAGALVNPPSTIGGSVVPGVVVLVGWAAAVVVAGVMRHRRLLGLHVVIGASLLLGVVSAARIFGVPWDYLTLWSWAVAALVYLSIGWTAFALLASRLPRPRRQPVARAAAIVLGALVVLVSGGVAVAARNVDVPGPVLSSTLGTIVPQTEQALIERVGSATGREGRYSVTWTDALYIGAQGYGLDLALERDGFTVGVASSGRVGMTSHRVIDPSDATAVIHLATGVHVDEWRSMPDAIEVAFVDPRSPAQMVEYDALRADAIRRLDAAGLGDLATNVDQNLFAAAIDQRLDTSALQTVRADLRRMLALGGPTAVFVAPPSTGG